MQIQLNGELRELTPGLTVAQLIDELGLSGRRIAVERNEHIVSKSEHHAIHLVDGDRIEIVHAIGGG